MTTRKDMFKKVGISVDVAIPLLKKAYENEEKQIWRDDLFSSPHGHHWHTSQHASQFPGDPETACPRKSIYSLMNIAQNEPVSWTGRAVMEAGLDIEDRIVKRFERAGVLLSEPPESEYQTNFQDKKAWLSGSSDLIIRVPHLNRPYPIEIKTKWQRVIDEMKAGKRGPDPQHVNQIMTYISLCHKYGKEYWPDLDNCISGSLLYVSRDNPSDVYEFKFDYDEKWWEEGIARLKEWNNYFIDETLPPRPDHFMWSKGACQYCPYKRDTCKPDFKDEVTKLNESHGIEWTKEVRGEYNYEETRQAVLNRWMKENA